MCQQETPGPEAMAHSPALLLGPAGATLCLERGKTQTCTRPHSAFYPPGVHGWRRLRLLKLEAVQEAQHGAATSPEALYALRATLVVADARGEVLVPLPAPIRAAKGAGEPFAGSSAGRRVCRVKTRIAPRLVAQPRASLGI